MKIALRLAGYSMWFGLSVGCGGPQAEPKTAPAAPASEAAPATLQSSTEAEPATLAEAERLLESARADLDRLALNEPLEDAANERASGAAAPAPSPPPPASAPGRSEERAQKSAADQAEAPAASTLRDCQTACKAFSSLERASAAVCRLDDEAGQRCARARQIRQDAERRVASCACAK